MFEIEKTFRFEAGHQLVYHNGPCARPHGHSYTVTVKLRSDHLINEGPKKNMVMDYGDISTIVKKVINNKLDHFWLNDTLNCDSTTAEFIAKWFFDILKPQIPMLCAVTVKETDSSAATYYLDCN